ncbi:MULTISPECIES: hypothetical protein [unclassified Colwellia]|uniref:hypothetical protein n=1 Tax=unclassified Colwellia TaxID=196834 RepID=UPI0015F69247|nr:MULTISPECIES: hypothetical protein [unclassified Colwellia]MBA6380324.1 hypothetical protein [Colwellia sp. BRX10-7]MBA6387738.1 hypothetical protein [Colwellia sp. BRX10-2]MBA6402646.1 hypothetical protein [Colwellia sp. BRX10-5]MBA6406036.1 hypothetical protein [Colwellia sp. BRX10-1]
MKRMPTALVKTWLFLLKSKDPKLARQKFIAYQKIKKSFGSADLAQLYIEQDRDNDIEVVII